jgi:ATP-binding cassette, subfamily B, multidrug efflux pump
MTGRRQDTTPEGLGRVRSAMARGPMQPGRIEKARAPRQATLRLAGYLRPHLVTLAVVFVFVLAYIALGLLEPYLIGAAIDRYIGAGQIAGLVRTAILLLVVFLLDHGFQAISSWLMVRVSQDALKRVRRDLFGHLQSLSLRFFDRHTTGELMSRLTNDIEAINQAVSQNVVSLVASLLSMIGILVVMFALNPWLALACVVVLPVMFWFTAFVARYTRRGFRTLQKQLGALTGVVEETFSGQRVVKAYGRSESAIAAFRRDNQEVCQAGVYANSYALSLMPLTNVLGNFFVIVLVGLGGWLAMRGLATIGMIAAFITYGRNFINPLRQIASMYNSIQAALAGAERVFEIMDTPSEIDAPAGEAPVEVRGDVRFENVSFGYEAGTPVIKHMTLAAKAGQSVALVGPTGAGKTTLINLLMRFYEVDDGRITIDGRDLRDLPKADLRRELGLVLQDTFLFSDTVMENIRYGKLSASDEDVVEAAKLADADHFIRALPQGYQTKLSERASNLSQGQRQMLSIARAILADPAILILDEATSSVDTRTELRIQDALLRLMKGRTSFIIAHRLSTIRDADQVVVINDGEIVEEGTHQQLLDRKGFYHDLYLSQFKGLAI